MTKIPTGRFVWFEYLTKDIPKAQGFFGELFNWKTQELPLPEGSYTMITLGEQGIGGYTPTPKGAPAVGHWLTSLQVADIHATAKQIESLGGKVHVQPTKMETMGSYAVVADPGGGVFALWQPAQVQGTGDYRDAAGAWCWNELAAHDVDAAVAFYTKLGFEHQAMEMPGPDGKPSTYHVLSSEGKPRAGIMKSPMPQAPQAWMPYVQVANCDQTIDKAKKLGATIALPPSDVATVGRLSIFTDPQGGWLGVLQPEKK